MSDKKKLVKVTKKSEVVGGDTVSRLDSKSSASSSNTKIPRTFAEQLDEILKLDDKDLANIDEDKLRDIRKNLNPYGRTIQGSDKYLNFSLTQIHHEYWKKFLVTSFIGFLNRMVDEWQVPKGVPVTSVYEYLADPSKIETPELLIKKGDKSAIYDYEFNKKWMEKRIIVKAFLEEMFQFNPDEHVRSAYKPNYADKERKVIDTAASRLAVKHLAATTPGFKAEKELYEEMTGNKPKVKKIKKVIKSKDGKVLKEEIKEVEVPPEEIKEPVKKEVFNMIPPHDLFGNFKRYYTENYEELREAVTDLYCEKPDLELAINPYSWHDSQEEADAFKKQHADEVISEVFTVHSGKWNFFDTFKEQRESVNFYNKNTAVLEEIVKQIEKDEKLGQDMMKKRVEKEKKKNVIEAGPDAESFKKWKAENKELEKLGAKYIGDVTADDTPDNAIEVPVWKIAKGGTEITKEKIYTLAEAPTFVKEAQEKAIASGAMKPT
jgi:hypothetical protein